MSNEPAPADPIRELRKRARILSRLLDDRGRVVRWPRRQVQRLMILEYIAEQLDEQGVLTESELGNRIRELHAFDDVALLRRALVDEGFLDRKRDGSAYWRRRRGALAG